MAHYFDGYQILDAIDPGRGATKVFWAPWRRTPEKLYWARNHEKALELRRRLTEEGPSGASAEIIYWGGTNFVVARYLEAAA